MEMVLFVPEIVTMEVTLKLCSTTMSMTASALARALVSCDKLLTGYVPIDDTPLLIFYVPPMQDDVLFHCIQKKHARSESIKTPPK